MSPLRSLPDLCKSTSDLTLLDLVGWRLLTHLGNYRELTHHRDLLRILFCALTELAARKTGLHAQLFNDRWVAHRLQEIDTLCVTIVSSNTEGTTIICEWFRDRN